MAGLKFHKVTSLPTASTALTGNIYFNETDKTINICTGTGYSTYNGNNTWRPLGTGAEQAAAGNHTHTFASLTSKPTTLAGYGITDAAASNHTHNFASLASKPTTISGYGITDALTTSNYNSYCPKLDGTGATGVWGINISGNAATSNRTKFLETFRQNSTTNTYGEQYPIWAQWSDTTNVRLKCTDYTVWTDKATYATSAGSVPGSGVTLTGYSKASYYSATAASDTVNQAIGKLEGALSGLETLLASI